MIDSGASAKVCPKWFAQSVLEKSDRSVQLRGADGRALQDYGKRHIWLRIGSRLRQCDFHEVAKPILSVSYLVMKRNRNTPRETTLLEERRETRTLDQDMRCVLRQGADRSRSQGHSRVMRTSRRFRTSRVYELRIHKTHVYELKIHKTHAYEQEIHKKSCVRAEDSRKSCVRAGDSQKSCVRADDSQKSCVRAGDSQNTSHADSQNSQNPCGSSMRDDAIVQPVV